MKMRKKSTDSLGTREASIQASERKRERGERKRKIVLPGGRSDAVESNGKRREGEVWKVRKR